MIPALILAASAMARADYNTTWQCLKGKCGLEYNACSFVSLCNSAIKCMQACSDKTCESNCMTDSAAKAKNHTVASAALVSLDLCGGYSNCFNYGNVLTKVEATGSCDKLDDPAGNPEWHCDPAGSGEAVMCITNKDSTKYAANRCCDGKWLFTAQQCFLSDGFNLQDAKTWNDKCQKENCCSNLSGTQCYQKQLADLGHLPDCDSTILV